MTERIVEPDGVRLCLETFGDPADPAVLLLAGAASSMDCWDPEFCARLAGSGRYVVRYDHRDTGRSQSSPPEQPSYTASDLGADPRRILDALGLEAAHLVGLSMGGGIAQTVAAQHPGRVHSLTLMATSPAGTRTYEADLPSAEPRVADTFDHPAPEPDWTDRAAVLDYLVAAERPYSGSLGFDEAAVRRRSEIVLDRTTDIRSATLNHWLVVDGDATSFAMADIGVPTLVLHGATDPMFPLAHGAALAAEIPAARLLTLPGMGHEHPPPALWDEVIAAIAAHTA